MKKPFLSFLVLALVYQTACQNNVPSTALARSSSSSTTSTTNQPPNIVFIMADDLGWGELGAYGNTFNETPNLDKLAVQGLTFTNAYAAAPVCSPTRGSLMTGQYPARVGITDFLGTKTDRYLHPEQHVTLNEALAQAGYHTGLVGKWHLDTDFKDNKGGPKAHGFHEVIGTETKYIADGDYFFPYDKISTFTTGPENEYLTDRQSQEGANFIRRNKAKPFFLYLSYYSVHTTLAAKQALIDKYKQKFDTKYGKGQAEKIFEGKNKKHQAKHLDNPYLAAMLESIDDGVGTIMQELEKQGLADNTLVVFYSDNGGAGGVANNGGLRMNKTWLYEGGIREPLIMRLPSRIKAGTRTDVPVSTYDFYPTFIDLANGTKPQSQKLDGISLVPLLSKSEEPKRETLYWHYPSETGNWKNRMSSAVRHGDLKLIQFYDDKRVELYNLKTDPFEKNDLAAQMPEKVAELQKMLTAWKAEVNAEQPAI